VDPVDDVRRLSGRSRSVDDMTSTTGTHLPTGTDLPTGADLSTGIEQLRERADSVLRQLEGRDDASFREGQWEAVRALVAERRRVLVVQRTGWGKSAVYFVATALRRAQGAGPTLIVSPLLALMRDQVAAAARAGVRAVTMNSSNAEDWGDVASALAADEVDVLLVSPERLNNPRFRTDQLPDLAARCGLLVVDEAHCISDWGHDFRPDYRRIRDLLTALPDGTPVLATTATANARVVHDVAEQLGAGGKAVLTVRGGLARQSLRLGVLRLPTAEQRLAWLVAHLADLPGSGIVYTLTVAAADDLATLLREAGHDVLSYTGRTDPADRQAAEDALRRNEVKALVATSALGMGFDKPDLGFVVHVGAPSSPIAYYQQVGRAGRATERADVLLLPGPEDRDIWRYFASTSMPRQDQADAVLGALGATSKAMSTAALESVVDVRRTRLELLLKVLDVEGAVSRVPGGWTATGQAWTYDSERYGRVSQARDREQQLMLDYEATTSCRMAFLQQALDDETAEPCGRCDRCAGPWYATDVPERAMQQAGAQLQRTGVEVPARSQWPSGMARLGVPVSGRIDPAERALTGRAVARLTDLGWGQRLAEVLQRPDAPADDSVVRASIAVLRDWGWARRPTGIVVVPSRRRPELLRSWAQALSDAGRLPLLGSLQLVDGGPTGEPGGNSAFRLAGVWERFEVGPQLAAALAGHDGPLLLLDDVVDSRWTLTVAARELRRSGADEVLPFALAQAG
jgi:ATP-dependent DNA helicase RecQ